MTHHDSLLESKNNPDTAVELGKVFSDVIDVMDIAVWELDLEYRIVALNKKAKKIYGDGIIGAYCYGVAAKLTDVCPDCPAQRVYEGEGSGRSEHQRVSVDGRTIYIDHIATPIRDEAGRLTGVLVLIIDITHRKQLENELTRHRDHLGELVYERTRELQESEQKFRAIFDNANDAIYLCSLDNGDLPGTILEVNDTACRRLGYTREEFLGMTPADFNKSSYQADAPAVIRRLREAGHLTFERIHVRKDGTELPVEITARLFEYGGRDRMLLVARDISARKQAEMEKAGLEQQFQQAQKMESIGRLAGGVAHDLNNLLTPILGYADMLKGDFAEGDHRRRSVEMIEKAGSRARNLVRQLLAFSRKQTLEFKPIDLNAMLKNFQKLLRRTIRENIAIHQHLSDAEIIIEGDLGQLEQVVMNLAVNAQDAMAEGGRLTIATSIVDRGGDGLAEPAPSLAGRCGMITFADTGHGMDAVTLKHLFEPFFTTKGKDQGTGLGLATVYGIVKQHGGHIEVASTPGGGGATFNIYLPLARRRAVSEKHPDVGTCPPAASNGSETVLLVEDDEDVRLLAETVLSRLGYRIVTAENGAAAMQAALHAGAPIDLLLTDVVMPGMNGKQLFETLSAVHPGLKVIYMSGYTDEVVLQEGMVDAGAAFIQKPFSVSTLAVKIREVLEPG